MSTYKNIRYSAVSKPPVIKNISKTNGYVRSPSTSRIVTSTNTRSIGAIPSSPIRHISNQPLGLSRKTGSCQNLSGLTNPVPNHTKMSPNNDDYYNLTFDKYKSYGTSTYGNGTGRSTTNNSFGVYSNHTSTTPINKSSFYNGYMESKSSKSRIITPRYPEKSLSSGSSSTNSPEASNNTVSNSFSGSSGTFNNTATSSRATTTTTHSTSTESSENNKAYNGESFISANQTRLSAYNSNVKLPQSETMKSLNNSLNEPRGLVGLANLRNTCFMNSVLQCLSNCKPLHDYCLSNQYEDDLNGNSKSHGALIKSYSDLMKSIWSSDADSYISPEKFKRQFQKIAPSFHGTSQQDSQEFLRIMLEGLHQDVNRVTQKLKPSKINEEEDEKLSDQKLGELYWTRYIRIDNSFIVDLFVGQLKSTLLCKKCGYKSVTFDPFWDLSLPIPKNRRDSISLMDCLDLFTSEEMLDGDEMPKCSKCKQKRPCTKRFSINKFPQILVIHLKRFSGDKFRSKISAFIEFPTKNLNLQQYDAEQSSRTGAIYNLYGVSNHSGTVYAGHYTAYCCNPYSHNWYMYNDTRVQRVNENIVCSSEAYVLFYELTQ